MSSSKVDLFYVKPKPRMMPIHSIGLHVVVHISIAKYVGYFPGVCLSLSSFSFTGNRTFTFSTFQLVLHATMLKLHRDSLTRRYIKLCGYIIGLAVR